MVEFDNLGNVFVGNFLVVLEGFVLLVSNFDGMDDDVLVVYYGEIIGEKFGNMKCEMMIKCIDDKLNVD